MSPQEIKVQISQPGFRVFLQPDPQCPASITLSVPLLEFWSPLKINWLLVPECTGSRRILSSTYVHDVSHLQGDLHPPYLNYPSAANVPLPEDLPELPHRNGLSLL